jgi:hypothetical protein
MLMESLLVGWPCSSFGLSRGSVSNPFEPQTATLVDSSRAGNRYRWLWRTWPASLTSGTNDTARDAFSERYPRASTSAASTCTAYTHSGPQPPWHDETARYTVTDTPSLPSLHCDTITALTALLPVHRPTALHCVAPRL